MEYLGKAMMKFWVSIACAVLLSSLFGCATIVKPSYQEVEIISSKKGIKMSTPYQMIELHQGINRVYLDRARKDIGVSLWCSPKSKAQTVYLSTHPSAWLLVGNVFSGQIVGWLVDFITEEGWNIHSPVNITSYCQ